jgi:hypothetical protein
VVSYNTGLTMGVSDHHALEEVDEVKGFVVLTKSYLERTITRQNTGRVPTERPQHA